MFSLEYLKNKVQGCTVKDSDVEIKNIVQLSDAKDCGKDTVSWISDKKLSTLDFKINCVLICSEIAENHKCLEDAILIKVENPRQAFAVVLREFAELDKEEVLIHSSAIIHPDAQIGLNFNCGPNVVIESDVIIGDNVSIGANTIIKKRTSISNNVSIGSNCTIGGIGFGYEKNENGKYVALPHLGGVIIEGNVEIGNNTCIDRAVLGFTRLRSNVKVDNLVHIAHGCDIGKNSLIIANAMVAGSVIIGENTWVAPSSSILNQLQIGSNVTVGMAAVVLKAVEDGDVVVGAPARSIKK